jgi:membrane associated rhomboid family serine protease
MFQLNTFSPVVKRLILVNAVMMVATYYIAPLIDCDLIEWFGLYYFASPNFHIYQYVTHMFMHGGWLHIFFNMYALYMFGAPLEQVWGGKRLLTYYFVTGLGAAALHTFVMWIDISRIEALAPHIAAAYMNIPTVGASGAVFGVLLAFGMLFPNTRLMLLFPPIPIKAKWFVLGYGLIELWLGIRTSGGSVAHFAHVGGMLFGWLLIVYWRKKSPNFY